MKTKDFFKINGVSSDEFTNVLVNLPPVPPLAERKYTEYDVGGDEDYTIADDAFKDIKYSVEFMTVDIPEYDNSELYKLIAEAKRLEISRLPGYYYKVRRATMQAPTSKYDGDKVTYKINFTLAPFKYFIDNPQIDVVSGDTVVNKGTRYSMPKIELTGTGLVEISVNGTNFTVDTKGEAVTIDSTRKITYYTSSGELIYNLTSGFYPMLASGNNVITHSGTSLKINLNERSY